jgi:hypothetical protein
MGLIHSRASKKRNKAEARLLDEQRKELRQDRRAAQAGERAEKLSAPHPDKWFREPTLGGLLSRGKTKKAEDDGDGAAAGPN